MHIVHAAKEGPLRLAQSLMILALAGLLIFYHTTMLVDYARGFEESNSALYNAIQSLCRVAIISSLTLVIMGKRFALWMMWFSIGSLIATHYWAHFGPITADFTVGRNPFSYLKGLIIPTIITTAFLYRRS